MALMTLLDMTQNILASMNSDEVNSISDTVESQQVAEEIKNTYFDLFVNKDVPELEGLITLEWPGDPDLPNTLQVPNGYTRIKWIKYIDYRTGNPKYNTVKYLDPEEFVKRIVELGTSTYGSYTTVPLLGTSSVEYTIRTDKAPTYYTIFNNDDILVFDSFDYTVETHLTGSNSLAWGIDNLTFSMEDNFVPVIPSQLFPQFLSEAKSACFINIKEVANSKEEQRARRQLVRSQYRLNKTNAERKGVFDAVDYSRKR
jgi:hypothetical protein